MGRIKSDNRHLGVLSGYEVRWIHNDGGKTTTVTPHVGEPVVLHGIDVNTTSASAIVVRDSAVGVIAVLKASIAEGIYLRPKRLKGNLIVENPGTSDITINFSND